MRYSWIPPVIVALDFISKLLLAYSPWSEGIYIIMDGLNFSLSDTQLHLKNSFFSIGFSTSSIILFSGVLAIILFLQRTSAGFINAFTLTTIGLQLAVGGIIAQFIDLFLHGQVINMIVIDTFISISISISELAIIIGLVLLLVDLLQRHLIPKSSVIPLEGSTVGDIDLSEAIIGIDNVHIDVYISPGFRGAVRAVANDAINNVINSASTKKSSSPYSYTLKNLREHYFKLIDPALKRFKEDKDVTKFEILYVAVIKLVQEEITAAFDYYNYEIKHNPIYKKPEYAQSGSKSTAFLLSNSSNTRNNVAKEIFSQFTTVENDRLKHLRSALFGMVDHLLSDTFKIPLLYASSHLDDYVLCHHYLLLNHFNEQINSFTSIDKTIAKALLQNIQSLPNAEDEIEQPLNEQDQTGLSFQKLLYQPSVLMAPHNITTLLDLNWSNTKLYHAKEKGESNKARLFRRHLRFQRYQLAQLHNEFEKANLIHDLMLVYYVMDQIRSGKRNYDQSFINQMLTKLFPNSGARLLPISTGSHRKMLLEMGFTAEALNDVSQRMKEDLSPFLLRVVKDFSRYRRDLHLLNRVQQAINKLQFYTSEKDILTSRSNHTLYEFLSEDEIGESQDYELVRHAILKADLRGSTRITEELTRKKLNPATHFSRNFFEPINEILAQYNAEKVFIEGDAMILIFNENNNPHSNKLCVSQACGLAADMLRIVEKQNKLLEKYKLPILELGIGIAFQNNPPRFLYDEESKITISPAINRADRLSSCAWAIKNWLTDIDDTFHVAMYEPSENARSIGAKAEKEMIYNLNGILIEDIAFEKLKRELNFRQIKNPIPAFKDSILLASKFPDTYGTMHTVIVRSAPVQIYDPSHNPSTAPNVEKRRYYEVIHDKSIIAQLISMSKLNKPTADIDRRVTRRK